MLYIREMELAAEIVIAQINKSDSALPATVVIENLESIFDKIRELTNSDNRGSRNLV